MLSDAEKALVSELLKSMMLGDLIELAKTSTGGIINPTNANDAIKAILLHSEDLKSLLMRKKIRKSALFKYLHDKDVSCPSNADKYLLVDLLLNFWNKSAEGTLVRRVAESNCEISGTTVDETIRTLAIKFAEWYYNRVNAIVQHLAANLENKPIVESLKEEDFWCDSQLQIRLSEGPSKIIGEYSSQGSTQCFTLIRDICKEHLLFFSPNLCENGTKGTSDSHGLILVLSCGTLHRATNEYQCVGVYEQLFGLIKDPRSEHNWKIKLSKLILRSQQVTSVPSLSSVNELSLSEL